MSNDCKRHRWESLAEKRYSKSGRLGITFRRCLKCDTIQQRINSGKWESLNGLSIEFLKDKGVIE